MDSLYCTTEHIKTVCNADPFFGRTSDDYIVYGSEKAWFVLLTLLPQNNYI